MQRLLIVSNRLPINVSRGKEDNEWKFQLSSGGLVSALAGVQKSTKFLWIGWPGIEVDVEERDSFSRILCHEYSAMPVYIDQKTSDLHYNGFSNSIIWPLFHYLSADISINEDYWEGYKKTNQIFADYICEFAEDGDMIWIHDYHLMLLPEMLRTAMEKLNKSVRIGFFLHIPFPTSEVFRVLPYRKEILEGILNSDLVGFHTYDYARHFLTSCTRILGSNTSPTSVEFGNRVVKVGVFPVGVDPDKFETTLNIESTKARINELQMKYSGLKVIVGVERLDYIKGLTQKLLAYEELLEENSDLIGKIVLIQIAIPSRTDVVEYQRLQNQVFELVGRINGRFSSLDYFPIQFIYNSVNFAELVALYRLADVCLVTSTRDGMNLVAYEYIATQIGKCGVLILSKFAGAAQSLNGAILINPWNINEIKASLIAALNAKEVERLGDHSHLLGYVKKFTASHWGQSFIRDLKSEQTEGREQYSNVPLRALSADIKTLTISDSLEGLGSVNEDSFLYSCKTKTELIEIANQNIGVFAECGIWIFSPNGKDWTRTCPEINNSASSWNDQLLKILSFYSDRVPHSEIRIAEGMICWKFDIADPVFTNWISSELQMNLEKFIGHLPLKVYRLKNEIRIMHVSADFVDIGMKAIKNYALSNNYKKIEIKSVNDAELVCIAEALMNECKELKVCHFKL